MRTSIQMRKVILNVTKLIVFLRTGRRTYEDIELYLNIGERQVRRYLHAIEDAGLPLINIKTEEINRQKQLYWLTDGKLR